MHINAKRRLLLKSSIAAGVATVTAAAGMLRPGVVLASWPQGAFDAKKIDDAMTTLFGSATTQDSSDIKIKAPSIAENGAVVNVEVKSAIPNSESISVLVEKNASPLALSADLSKRVEAFVKTRVKIGNTSKVVAVVKADGKLYSASKQVKVTIGGCGG